MSLSIHPRMISPRWRDLVKSKRAMIYFCQNWFLMVYSAPEKKACWFIKLFCVQFHILTCCPEWTGYEAQEQLAAPLRAMQEFSRHIAILAILAKSRSRWIPHRRRGLIIKSVMSCNLVHYISPSQFTDEFEGRVIYVFRRLRNSFRQVKLQRQFWTLSC